MLHPIKKYYQQLIVRYNDAPCLFEPTRLRGILHKEGHGTPAPIPHDLVPFQDPLVVDALHRLQALHDLSGEARSKRKSKENTKNS